MQIHIEYTGFQQHVQLDGSPFIPMIYEGKEDVPDGFNVVCVALDASDSSALKWQDAVLKASSLAAQGFLIMWDLQLALLDGSLEDDARFMTLQLGLRHFLEAIWPSFQDKTFGFILYRGLFSFQIKNETIEYLKLLAALLPEAVPCFLFLDTTKIIEPASYFQLMSLEVFGYLRLAIKGPFSERYPYALPALSWGHYRSPLGCCTEHCSLILPETRIEYAICLPENGDFDLVAPAIATLGEAPFRAIPEALLTQEWDGIEKLIIFPEYLHERGWRKVRGFLAAGGEIVPYRDQAQ